MTSLQGGGAAATVKGFSHAADGGTAVAASRHVVACQMLCI